MSSQRGLRSAYARLGVVLTEPQAQALLDCIRQHVATTKQPPVDADLLRFQQHLLPAALAA